MRVIIILLLTLFFSLGLSAKSHPTCVIGDYYKQTKTLDFYSHTTKRSIRIRKKRHTTIIMKVIRNKGWGCRVKLYKQNKNKKLTPLYRGQTYTVSYRYFKKGTISTVISQLNHLPKKIDTLLAPVKTCNNCIREKNSSKRKQKVSSNSSTTSTSHSAKKSSKVQDNILQNYARSPGVKKMLTTMKQNCRKFCCANICKKRLPYRSWCRGRYKRFWDFNRRTKTCSKSLGICYGYVKLGLSSSGFINDYLKHNNMVYPWTSSPYAKDAGVFLKKAGFINILKDKRFKNITPYNAPKGAVIVYGGSKRSSGHIEIVDIDKNGNRKYYSDFVENLPICDNPRSPSLTRKTRPIIGIYIKEDI